MNTLNMTTKMTAKNLITLKFLSLVTAVTIAIGISISPTQAQVTNSGINSYAQSMKRAANAQDINQVSKLIADDALIKFTRQDSGKASTMNKQQYLKLLTNRWQSSNQYQYDISINNVVISGNKAMADIKTVEKFIQDGTPMTYISESKTTLTGTDSMVLSRFIAKMEVK